MKKVTIIAACLIIVAAGCRSRNETVQCRMTMEEAFRYQSLNRYEAFRFDSAFSHLKFEADSMTVIIPADTHPDSVARGKRGIKVTVHNLRGENTNRELRAETVSQQLSDSLRASRSIEGETSAERTGNRKNLSGWLLAVVALFLISGFVRKKK